MNKFGETIEKTEKQEAHEIHEAPKSVEKSAAEIGQQMIKQSENEVANFQIEGESELGRLENRAEKDEAVIESEDKKSLGEINAESNAAKEEFITEIDRESKIEKIPTYEQLDAFEKGKEKILSLHAEGNNKSSEYFDLYSHLTEGFGENIKWVNENEIDIEKVKAMMIALNEKKEETMEKVENMEIEKAASDLEKIDSSLFRFAMGEEGFKKYLEDQKNLPPDAIIHLYHGLNSGSYESVMDILDSPSHGIEQRSGPTVALVPVGQFWKGLGFRYALRRDQIEFPGENNPNAVIRMRGDDGMEDSGYIVTESGNLPLDEFDAEIMRSSFADPDPVKEKEMMQKLDYYSKIRASRSE